MLRADAEILTAEIVDLCELLRVAVLVIPEGRGEPEATAVREAESVNCSELL